MLVEKGAWPSGRLYFTPLLSSVQRETRPSCVDYLRNSVGNRGVQDSRKYELPRCGLVPDV